MRSPFPPARVLTALLASLPGALAGCAAATLSLDSSPQKADVYVSTGFDSQGTKIGSTPLTITSAEASRAAGSAGGPIYVEFRKQQRQPARAVITDVNAGDLRLNMTLAASNGLEDQDATNAAVDMLFESQRMTLAGRYDDALTKIKQLQKESPQLAAPYEIEGGIYVMQKKLPEALDAYRAAARINPRNPETIRMRNYLEGMVGAKTETPQ